MRKLLATLLLLSTFIIPTSAQLSIYGILDRSTLLITMTSHDNTGEEQTMFGTTFCVPERSTTLLTAGHAIGPDLAVFNRDHTPIEILSSRIYPKEDIAIIIVKEPLCMFSPLKWAKENATVGTTAWLYGYGSGLPKPIMTKGIISSTTNTYPPFPQRQLAQLEGEFGHSGSPIVNDNGEVIGMLTGGYSNGGDMNTIIPVELLKKAVGK